MTGASLYLYPAFLRCYIVLSYMIGIMGLFLWMRWRPIFKNVSVPTGYGNIVLGCYRQQWQNHL